MYSAHTLISYLHCLLLVPANIITPYYTCPFRPLNHFYSFIISSYLNESNCFTNFSVFSTITLELTHINFSWLKVPSVWVEYLSFVPLSSSLSIFFINSNIFFSKLRSFPEIFCFGKYCVKAFHCLSKPCVVLLCFPRRPIARFIDNSRQWRHRYSVGINRE